MTARVPRAFALALSIAIIAVAPASAQVRRMAFQGGSTKTPQSQAGEQLPPSRLTIPPSNMNGGMDMSDAMNSPGPYPDGWMGDGFAPSGNCSNGCCDSGYGGYDGGCCDTCGGYGGGDCSGDVLGCNPLDCVCPPGRYYITADYIYARANFSEAISFLDKQSNQGNATDTFHELDFNYEHSYRVGGGYKLCNCCDEIRFMFTRLSSTANDIAPFGSTIPYEVTSQPDGQTFIHADVDVKSYDVDFARTIQLGGNSCGCGDPCGYGGGCGCPAWDITWSGGFRFADVSWNRTYNAVDVERITTTNAISVMDFRGGGLRFGLEGRRYFCQSGCISVYLKGDISLLLGDVDLAATRLTFDASNPEVPETTVTQTHSTRQIVPVTEIETGLTGHITCNSSITTGYMFNAWHDLGFRDEFTWVTLTQMETTYDDANILGFDGFFARLEVAF